MWMTQSQLNLCNIDNIEPVRKRLNTVSNFPISGQHKLKISPSKKPQTAHTSVSFVDPPSVVLGGSSSKITSIVASKLKFPPKVGNGDDNLLTKIKNKTAVLKIQTLKSNVSRTSGETSSYNNEGEKEILVQPKTNCSVVPIIKPKVGGGKSVISKPKTPPPPPPVKTKPPAPSIPIDSEKTALLKESPGDELSSNIELRNSDNKNSVGSIDSLNHFHIELKIPSGTDTVPKTGFDFLDNW